jgi:2-oxoisovalerate dehydrogenase E1 component
MPNSSRAAVGTSIRGKAAKQRKAPERLLHDLDDKFLLWSYRTMVLARLLDEKSIVLYKQNKSHFQISCAGHEAVQVAASKIFRVKQDWFYPYYRDMALCVGLGMTAEELMMNAINRVGDPNSHGRMMPMHYGHKNLRIVPQSSPTGTQFLQAVGCALGAKMKKCDEVVYVSAGEGTCAQGDFHEALNWASRDKLPVVFLIENNNYAISVHISEQLAGQSVARLGSNYENLFSCEVNGSDIRESFAVLRMAHDKARSGEGPSLIEAHVPRLLSHSISDNHLKYRSAEDIAQDQLRCPLRITRSLLLDRRVVTHPEIEQIHTDLKRDVDSAAEWAEAQPTEDVSTATHFTFTNTAPWEGVVEEVSPSGAEVFVVDAINHGLDEELARNPEMCIFGEDVAHGKGGVFTVTAGLTAKYGVHRVFNSQLAESSIIGVAVGLATRGMKPVAEVQFGDYIWTGAMQIRNELAMLSYRSRGDFTCPAVIRVPVGGYIRGGAYHSQNIEATFAHFPGLYVVYPSNATDAKGLLKAAIRANDPVLFLEHKGLYRQVYAKGREGDADSLVPIGRAKTVRPGSDVTVVTWGALVQKSILAAQAVEQKGFSVEVIDLRTIVPLDIEHVFESVRRTNRVIVAQEDVTFMGFGSEVVSQIADECFRYLDAPVKRVGMKYAAAVPHEPGMEDAVLPQVDDVVRSLEEVLRY